MAIDPSPTTPSLLRWGWPRWSDLAPEVVLGAGLLVFLVAETDAATSSFASGRAVGIMATTAVAWLIGRVVTARLLPWSLLRIGLFGAAAVLILQAVVLPSFRDTTVVETFPVASPTTAAPSASPTTVAAPAATAPAATASAASSPTTAAPAATAPVSAVTTALAAAEPVRLRSGAFTGIDHRAEGAVHLYRQPDGTYVVGLEDIDIQPGPDYDVYVVPGPDRDERDGGTRLDDLRGNQGTQFYEVPAGLSLEDGPWTVLVWCQTFGVPIANATPS